MTDTRESTAPSGAPTDAEAALLALRPWQRGTTHTRDLLPCPTCGRGRPSTARTCRECAIDIAVGTLTSAAESGLHLTMTETGDWFDEQGREWVEFSDELRARRAESGGAEALRVALEEIEALDPRDADEAIGIARRALNPLTR